jgi:NADH-quinone oxidoreductase subunit J
LFLLGSEFLALLLIVVYVGAIAVLFLFAIMLLEFKLHDLNNYLPMPLGFTFGVVLVVPLLFKVSMQFGLNPNSDSFYVNTPLNWYSLMDAATGIEALGHALYSYFILQFLLSGLVLLLVVLGVVYLTNFSNYMNIKGIEQYLFKQLSIVTNLKK